MSRAEERALEAYPEDWWFANPGDWGIVKNPRKKDYNAEKRAAFILGYERAEKDLALTWEDMQLIWQILDMMSEECKRRIPEWAFGSKSYFTEVLKRFKEAKK